MSAAAEVAAHIWVAVQHLWATEDGQFLLVAVPFCVVFAGLLAAQS